ncbi:M23/M37 peptidase [Parvularcula bermudensis HTCC2503]|uniref:M23/M37 peptidase n=1 Tax=Parvularcula bermudensis (strain ATCC BAA-594 / HTCC2503 / KCTC 12087) TaxID=314260 RepID=E0TD97_PARBH|nr:M23 family metallopeptidase [Parvularcula bermudensis]ADM09920.1 M23/M37 peptidase [Parvularcula bermudensis HTCC2503]
MRDHGPMGPIVLMAMVIGGIAVLTVAGGGLWSMASGSGGADAVRAEDLPLPAASSRSAQLSLDLTSPLWEWGAAPRVRPDPVRLTFGASRDAAVSPSLALSTERSVPAPGPILEPVVRPRLKPIYRGDDIPVVKAIDRRAAQLAPSDVLAFASGDDFTGGREALFAQYQQDKAEERRERGYMTLALNRGETLSQTLESLGGDPDDIDALLTAVAEVADPKRIEAGTAIDYALEPVLRQGLDAQPQTAPIYDVKLTRLRWRPDDNHLVTAWRRSDGSYTARHEKIDFARRYAAAAGVISHSLFTAGSRASVPNEVMQRFANLYLYDVDFARDIYRGDRFEVVYEVFYDDHGQYVGSGEIVFAAMTWRGGSGQRAFYRFEAAGDEDLPYYDSKGESGARLLMKTPIEGARVTSSFGRRRHPVLGYTKTHKGVDFGAPSGTPIMAAGDGVIERAAMTGSFGNYVKIKHQKGFATAYAHLKGYGPGIKTGARVRQGDIIGYVGTTGRSTGPHLHYEVLKDGQVQNPMTLKVTEGRRLEAALQGDFDKRRDFVDTIRVRPLTVASAN